MRQRTQVSRGKGVRQISTCQSTEYGLAQIALRQTRHGRVNRRERGWQVAAARTKTGVQHGPAEKAAAHFAPHPHQLADRQGFLLRRVKVEKAQGAGLRPVIHPHDKLLARAVIDFTVHHAGFNLHHLALARVAQFDDAGFVLVPQRQVQGQIDVAVQTELVQRFLRR